MREKNIKINSELMGNQAVVINL